MFVLNLKSAHWPPQTIYHHRERPCCFLVTILLAVLGSGCESRVKLIVHNCFQGVFQNILLVQNGALPFTFPQMLSMFSETYQGFKFMPLVTFSHVLFFLVIVLYGTDSEISTPMKIICFHILALINKAAMNIGVHVSFLINGFFPRYIPRRGLLRHSFIFLVFWEPSILFAQWLHQFTFPPTVFEVSLFSTSSPTFVICLLDGSHSDGFEMIAHCDFSLHLSGG